jgi:hypothetical protein
MYIDEREERGEMSDINQLVWLWELRFLQKVVAVRYAL